MCRWPRLSTCDAGTLPATDGWGQVYYEVTRTPHRGLCLCRGQVIATRGANKMLWFFYNLLEEAPTLRIHISSGLAILKAIF